MNSSCDLRTNTFPAIGTAGGAAFQELIPDCVRTFAASQLTRELDYGNCTQPRSRFKLLLQFDPSSIHKSMLVLA